MTDTQTTPEQTEAPADVAAETTTEKPVKAPKPESPCGCRGFIAFDKADPKTEFDTGCQATTPRRFTQGHDAKTASFLVEAELDGYGIKSADGKVTYAGAVDAATRAGLSEPLVAKIGRAVENGRARQKAKADKAAEREAKKAERAKAAEAKKAAAAEAKAAKADGPKDVAAKVADGSQEGDAPTGRNVVVKIGKNEYEGELAEDGKTVTYLNNQNEPQTRDVDTVRILSRS